MDPCGTCRARFMVTARYFREKPLLSQTERFYWTISDLIKFDRKYDHMEHKTSKTLHVGVWDDFPTSGMYILRAFRAKT